MVDLDLSVIDSIISSNKKGHILDILVLSTSSGAECPHLHVNHDIGGREVQEWAYCEYVNAAAALEHEQAGWGG